MSLVAWFPLNGNLNNNGLDTFAVSGTPAYIEGGKIGQYAYDLSKRVTFTIPSLVGATEFSISFWCKINPDENLSTNWVDILSVTSRSADDTSSASFRFETCYGSVTNVGIGAYEGGTNSYIGTSNAGTLTSSKDSVWYHVCVVANDSAGKVRWYINGIQKVVQDYNGGHLNGYGYFGEADKVNGALQDVRFYNHALSVKEVKELAKGLVTHLPLDWGANPNIIPDNPVVTIPTEVDSELGTVYVRSTTATTESYIYSGRSEIVEASTKYTLSALIWVNEYVSSVDLFWLSTNTTNKKTGSGWDSVTNTAGLHPIPNQWNYITWTFTTKANDYTGFIRIDNNGTTESGTAAILKVKNIKLEKGEIATPYIPNVEETAYVMGGFSTKFLQDCSGYNRNVTISGTGISNAEGAPRGTGTNFLASTKVTISDGFPVGTQTPFTIAYWHKALTQTYTRYNDSIGFGVGNSTSTSATSQFRREVEKTDGSNYMWFGNGTVTSGGMCSYAPTMDTWYHCALTFDGTTFKQYINGTQQSTGTLESTYSGFKTYSNLWINDSNNMYQEVADVRIYATALSADDVKELYQVSAQIDKTGKIYCNQLVEE